MEDTNNIRRDDGGDDEWISLHDDEGSVGLSTDNESFDEDAREREMTRRRIERNDPDLVELEIGMYAYFPPDGDWAGAGDCIGRNTRLEGLTYSDPDWEMTEDAMQQFFGGVACNRSIWRLSVQESNLFDGGLFAGLDSFFGAGNLVHLEIVDCHLQPDCITTLATALSGFSSLEEFRLTETSVDDERAGELMPALARHSHLRKLVLAADFTGTSGCAALASFLENSQSKLAFLDLRYNRFDDEGAEILAAGLAGNNSLSFIDLTKCRDISEAGWHSIFAALQTSCCGLENLCLYNNYINGAARALGNALSRSTNSLKILDLGCNEDIDIRGWKAVFESLQSPACMLEDLNLSSNWLYDESILSLASALGVNNTLKRLNLSDNSGITNVGWEAFWNALEGNDNSALEELNLSCNTINDEAVSFMSHALISNRRMRRIDLSGTKNATPAGWEALAPILDNPLSALERVNLDHNNVNDGTVTSLAACLANNDKLTELIMYGHSPITYNGWSAISEVLCNPSSILATYRSNHTLVRIFEKLREDRLPEDIRSLLQINKENSKSEAARLKIIKTHFSSGFTSPPFIDMEAKILPYAIAWMARGGYNDHFYGFIRSMPLLFEVSLT